MLQFKFQDTSLPVDERVNALLKELTVDEKITLLSIRQQAVPRLGLKEFAIGTEAARGLICRDISGNGDTYSTVFPQPFGLAASFDPDLMHEIGVAASTEARAYNKKGDVSLCLWSPTVDLERDPRWGRTEEGYGEDPVLTGAMGAAYTKGMYGTDPKYARTIPTLKHFYANNHEENRNIDNASIPAALKHDYYLKAFELPMKNGAAKSVMTAYNEINGIEAMCSPEVSELKKSGMLFAVTDGWDLVDNVTAHESDETVAEAVARTLKNRGADIFNDERDVVTRAAKEALERGLMDESDIDNALFGALKARFLLGEFDDSCKYNNISDEVICCDDFCKTSLRAAEESITLLRNKHGVLPLNPKEHYAVVGVHADMNFRDWYTGASSHNPTILDGLIAIAGRENITYESGNDIIILRNAKTGFYFEVNEDGCLVCDSPQINEKCLLELYEWGEGAVSFKSKYNGKFLSDCGVMKCSADIPFGWFVKEKFYIEYCGGKENKVVIKNWQKRYLSIDKENYINASEKVKPQENSYFNISLFSSGMDRVRKAVASTNNTIMFCGGYPHIMARECYDRNSLRFAEKQIRIIEEVLKLRSDAVLAVISGYPYTINDEITTVIHSAHGGPQMGKALAKTLFGKISPAGRCPMTWYSSENELGDIKDYNIIRTESTYRYYKGEPTFAFGHGLAYTTFRYSDLKLNKTEFTSGEEIEVTLNVSNEGVFNSDEVVQLYVKAPRFSSAVPKKELKAFRRIRIDKTKTAVVRLTLNTDDLGFWNINSQKNELWSGVYEIQIGASSDDIRLAADITIKGVDYPGIDVTKPVPAACAWEYIGVEFRTSGELREYALLADWQSSITYENCRLNGETKLEVTASNPTSVTTLKITDAKHDTMLAEIEIPPTGSLTRFDTFTANVAMPAGTYDLKITSGKKLSLCTFKLTK